MPKWLHLFGFHLIREQDQGHLQPRCCEEKWLQNMAFHLYFEFYFHAYGPYFGYVFIQKIIMFKCKRILNLNNFFRIRFSIIRSIKLRIWIYVLNQATLVLRDELWKEKWYFVSKIGLTYCEKKMFPLIEKNFWNSKLKAENFKMFWKH